MQIRAGYEISYDCHSDGNDSDAERSSVTRRGFADAGPNATGSAIPANTYHDSFGISVM